MKKKREAKKKKAKRLDTRQTSVDINLNAEQKAYVEELAEYSCTNISIVCAVMMATGIYKARRYELPFHEELTRLRAQLAKCRQVMEVNDPLNARDIFGPAEPLTDPQAAEGQVP